MIKLSSFVLLMATQVFGTDFVLTPYETRMKVAVIDTGIYITEEFRPYLCNDAHVDFTHTGITDTHGHGTNIAGIIAHDLNPKDFCIKVIKFSNGEDYTGNYIAALQNAVDDPKIKYINISAGGFGHNLLERQLILAALKAGKYVIVAAGNNSLNLNMGCNVYPACYFFMDDHFRVVGSGKSLANHDSFSNHGTAVTDWRDGNKVCAGKTPKGIECHTGTSQSTALFTNSLLKKHLKFGNK